MTFFFLALVAAAPELFCTDGARAKNTRGAIRALGSRIEVLKPTDDPKPLVAEMQRILKGPCVKLAALDPRQPAFVSSVQLREWWEAGGSDWLFGAIELPRYGTSGATVPHVVLAPDVRKVLSKEMAPDALLCRRDEPACGPATVGWRLRADVAMAEETASSSWSAWETRSAKTGAISKTCRDEHPDGGWAEWRACIEARRPTRSAIPLGRTRAPDRGWLIIEGRRGHYSFCDGVSAYDLATGAAYRSTSCSHLSLQEGGTVDHEKTNAARTGEVMVGTVPVDNLREALWMMALLPSVEEVQPDAEVIPLPEGMVPDAHTVEQTMFLGHSGGFSTAQTRLMWLWVDGERVLARGQVVWPNDARPASNHATGLLRIAEAGFTKGCPPARLPSQALMQRGMPKVSGIDARADDLVDAFAELQVRIAAAAAGACKPE